MPPKSNKRGSMSQSSGSNVSVQSSGNAFQTAKLKKSGGFKREIPNISWTNRLSESVGKSLDQESRKLLEGCLETSMTKTVTLDALIAKSDAFPLKFPIDTVRCSELQKRIPKSTLEHHANSVYPLIHEDIIPLIADWLKHKRERGSLVEKELYKDMGLVPLVQRLLDKRAVCFMGRKDKFKTYEIKLGYGGWETIGTEQEKDPLVLEKYISYDEVKLSAMLTMSSHTEFINDGSRKNKGVLAANEDEISPRGIIFGVIGSRFQRPGFMEYQDIAIAPEQNTAENGYGTVKKATNLHGLRQVWARFYQESHLPLHEEVAERLQREPETPKYVPVGRKYIFDAENYLKRTLVTAEMILLEANARAKEAKTNAYIHVVGFGLGVWKALPEQEIYFVKAFEIAIKKLLPKIKHVSDIMFAYLKSETNCGGVEDGGNLGHIKLHFGKREPHAALDEDKLIVATYAWDGNALPGNEFWMNKLATSGDPAAACSTQIAELHNTKINSCASAEFLRIASPNFGVLHVAEYAKLILKASSKESCMRK